MSGEILTVEQMARADADTAASGTSVLTLMENAGKAVADAVTARFAPCPVLVLCGPGNNGGDGYVVARLLAAQGFEVRTAALGVPKGEAAIMARQWGGARLPIAPGVLEDAQLVVDGLFGAGLSRPLEGAVVKLVRLLNAGAIPVVAIDVPSGVAGDSGAVLGDHAIQARLTVTFFRKKPAHLLLPGRVLCGEVVLADIGIPDSALPSVNLFENSAGRWSYPWPRLDAHKYARGHAVVLSGPAHATGAARLAARAALRIGAGLVSVASPEDAADVNAAHLTAIMIKVFSGAKGLADLLQDRRLNAVVAGPGLGVGGETRELVGAVLASGAGASAQAGATIRGVVLDADALTSFQADPDALFARIRNPAVLTPHAGEFERLFPHLLDESAGKLEAARTAAARAGAVVLLKGPDTVIAAPDGMAVINANAPPTLATAGAGDVLAGMIAGLLAQGMDAFSAACAGAWMHGDAAGRFGPGLIAEDLPDMLPEVLAGLRDHG